MTISTFAVLAHNESDCLFVLFYQPVGLFRISLGNPLFEQVFSQLTNFLFSFPPGILHRPRFRPRLRPGAFLPARGLQICDERG